MRLDIGDASPEPGDDGGRISVVIDAAAHELDGDVDRLGLHFRIAQRPVERAEGGELEQAGDRAAMEIARPAEHGVAEWHHEAKPAIVRALGANAEELGIGWELAHRDGLDAGQATGNKRAMHADALFNEAEAALRANRVVEARNLFGRAGEAGRHDAAVIHCNLTASSGDWAGGIRLLAELARSDGRCRRQFELIRSMDLAAALHGEVVSEAPHLTLFRGLFSAEECRYLIEAATPMLAPAVVVDSATGAQRPDRVRISDSAGFTLPLENPAVHALNQRLAAASGTNWAQGEPLQVLRYRSGGEYKPHFDAIPGFANQRILTMIVWLNDGYEGGETHFLKTGARLKGRTGDALLFRNALPDGRRDEDAGHAGLPVTKGEKLIASRWIRARPFELA